MKFKWSDIVGAIFLMIPMTVSAFQNEPDGFRGIKWGTDFSANTSEMSVVEKVKDEIFYFRKGDKLSIGGAELKRITYGYRKGKLMSIMLNSSGINNKTALIDAFREQFGRPDKPNQFLDQYWWRGPVAVISLDCNPIRHECMAIMFSTDQLNQRQEEKKKEAEAAKKDF